jgi:hypothetical protein
MQKKSSLNLNLTKFILDLLIFIGFLLGLDPRLTGIGLHEWLTIAGCAAIVLHLLLSWKWIADLTRRFFRKTSTRNRLNYILNWLLFIAGVLVMLTGLLISEVALPQIGLSASARHFTWRQLHSLTADLSLILLALHLALNWGWVVTILKRYIYQPIANLRNRKTVVPAADEVQS